MESEGFKVDKLPHVMEGFKLGVRTVFFSLAPPRFPQYSPISLVK